MYEIRKEKNHLLVEFLEDFDFSMIKAIIRHETMLEEYPDTNDIWLIGKHRADIRLGEVETMVKEFQCLCPPSATRTKSAVVVNNGLTGAIIELWVNGLKKRVAFELKIFHTMEEAETWLGISESIMA